MTSSATWEEIKRLAADFQRIQLVESTNKLSERNCIEIVSKLIKSGLLNAVYTLDGKCYVTDGQIIKEIYDELYVHEGRVSLSDLQRLLNIDISHIENKISELTKSDSNLIFVTGQIVSKDYMNKICEEINDLVQEKGNILLSDLSNQYELPIEFFTQMIRFRIGSIIKGHLNEKFIYTENYVQIQKAKLAGALEASLRPVRLSVLIRELELDVAMSFDLIEELLSTKQIEGTIFGGKQESAVYVPKIYVNAQKLYVESFYRQNGYIDFSSLKRIGITEPDQYVKELLSEQSVHYLSACCISTYLLDQIESSIEENVKTLGYGELSSVLPSILNEKDTITMAKYFLEKMKQIDLILMSESILVGKEFLRNLAESFQKEIDAKTYEDLKNPKILLALKSNHITLSGSFTQTQSQVSSKGKGKSKNKVEQVDDSILEIRFIEEKELEKSILSKHKDLAEDLLPSLVEYLIKPLNQKYLETLKSKYETGISMSEGDLSKASSFKVTIKETQEKIRDLTLNARVFDKALKTVTNSKLQDMLVKHLIKTICNDMVNELFKYVANEQGLQVSDENLNNESRLKLLQKLKTSHKQQLTELNQILNTKTPIEVIESVEASSASILEMQFKKFDQKKEREVTLQLRETTKSALENEHEPATILHLVSLLIYNHTFKVMLNAPGRCVPLILESLRSNINKESYEKLIQFQNKIIENLAKDKQEEILTDSIQEIKEMGLNAQEYTKN